jgi:hypothetical protein
MRCYAQNARVILVLTLGASILPFAGARQQGEGSNAHRVTGETGFQQQTQTGFQPLSRSEGSAVLKVALNSHQHSGAGLDCSHFVQGMYERAGFAYQYASSSDLYDGIDEFRRVTNPQPGDLAVWRGHAGIVVDPSKRSFVSILRSGLGIDFYDSRYWKRRGHPRFYRYIKQAPNYRGGESIRSASLRDSVSINGRSSDTNSENPTDDVPQPIADSSPLVLAQQHSTSLSAGNSASHPPSNPQRPSVLTLSSTRPKTNDVRAVFLKDCADSESRLRDRNLFQSVQPIVVFDHFDVVKIHLAKDAGWVDVDIDEVMLLSGGRVDGRRTHSRQRWTLHRNVDRTWELSPAMNATYLTQQAAERIVAHSLAQLTEDDSDTTSNNHEKAELARLLSRLFEQ